jgi:glycosyltransferase involved in cell wall biosynthesis
VGLSLDAIASMKPTDIADSPLSERRPAAMQPAASSAGRCTYLIGCDVKNDIRVFSGSTYHLALEGVQDGLLTGMMNLYPRGIEAWRVYARAGWWRLRGGIRRRRGFKYTEGFLDGVWQRGLPALQGSIVINNFQLFGWRFLKSHQAFGIEPYFYIDGTLDEYFGSYRPFDTAKFDDKEMRQALAVEREGYASCRKIVVMSKRTAINIADRYNVPQNKIYIVPPGANIPEQLLTIQDSQPERHYRPKQKAFVIGFIGLFPERKGLPTIAEAVRLLRAAGYDIRLFVIGNCPPLISQQDGVTHFGAIDKRVETDRFIEIVRSVDIGCMLSHAELTGIALLEFLRMGVPIIATDVGGTPDIVGLGAGELVPPDISPDDLAQHFARMIDEPERLTALQQNAWRRRHNASWRRAVRELRGVLNESGGKGIADEAVDHYRQP